MLRGSLLGTLNHPGMHPLDQDRIWEHWLPEKDELKANVPDEVTAISNGHFS